MTWDELEEIRVLVERMCAAVLSTAPMQVPTLNNLVGRMLADENMAHIATFSTALAVALDISRQAGAKQQDLARVRTAALLEAPTWPGAVATKLAAVRLSLASEARAVMEITFKSRDAAADMMAAMNVAFSDAALEAADDLDAGTYAAIITLQSDVVKYLSDAALRLPYIVDYANATAVPALRMAQNVYGTGTRASELIDENRVVHPAFMPLTGRMLAT